MMTAHYLETGFFSSPSAYFYKLRHSSLSNSKAAYSRTAQTYLSFTNNDFAMFPKITPCQAAVTTSRKFGMHFITNLCLS